MYKSDKKKLIRFLIGSAFFLGIVLFFNKGCAYVSGGYEAYDFQNQQLRVLGLPDNTLITEKREVGPNYGGVAISISYKTDLSKDEIIKYYKYKLEKKGWKNSEFHSVSGDEDLLYKYSWKRNNHFFSLIFRKSSMILGKNKIKYAARLSWGKRLGFR